MTIEEFTQALHLNDATVAFIRENGFEEAESTYTGNPIGLSEAAILERLDLLKATFAPEPLLEAAARARENEIVKHVFHYLSHYWWHRESVDLYGYKLPKFKEIVGDDEGGILDLALALEAFPAVREKFAIWGIPDKYALDALERINRTVADYGRFNDGKFGYPESGHHWVRHFINGELFRIGRLEYLIKEPPVTFPLENGPTFFRRKSDRAIIGLCRDGWRLNKEGLQLWQNDLPESAAVTARLEFGDDYVRGIPVNPEGFAEISRTLTLSLNEFEPVWSKGDMVPDIHIPGGGGMTPELCRQSLVEATDFFRRYFHQEVKGFTSFSWIYNPDLAKLLPQSNLAAFMRELYLSPYPSTDSDGLSFVFGKSAKDWSDFPRKTSLQRTFHQLRESGRRLKEGGMFIDRRGIENFGKAIYHSEYATF